MNIFLDMVVREARASFRGGVIISVDACIVQVLLFADDTVLVTNNEEAIQHNIKALQKAISGHKLAVNWGKTNVMVISREATECDIMVEGHSLKSVNKVVLGVKFSADGRMDGELDRRIGSATSAFEALKENVFGSKELSRKAKMEVYNAMVVPMMTYGCESWVLRERVKARLQATKMSVQRKVAGVTRLDCIRSEYIRCRLQQRSILEVV